MKKQKSMNPAKTPGFYTPGFQISSCSLPDFAKAYLFHLEKREGGCSPKTLSNTAYYLHLFLCWVSLDPPSMNRTPLSEEERREYTHMDARRVTIDDLRRLGYVDMIRYRSFCSLRLGNAPPTVNAKIRAVKQFFFYLCEDAGLLPANPALRLRLQREIPSDEPMPLLSPALLQQACREMTEPNLSRDLLILQLFFSAGLQVSELVGLNRQDADLNPESSAYGCLKICPHRPAVQRIVWLNDACIDALEAYLEELEDQLATRDKKSDPDALLISPRTGQRYTTRRIQQIVRERLTAAGVSESCANPRTLRNSMGVNLAAAGFELSQLQQAMGCKSLSAAERYFKCAQQADNDFPSAIQSFDPLSLKTHE